MDTSRYTHLEEALSNSSKKERLTELFKAGCQKLFHLFQAGKIPDSEMQLIIGMIEDFTEPDRYRRFIIGDLVELSPSSRKVVVLPKRTRIQLRIKEYQLLRVLVLHEGRMIPKEVLFQLVWGFPPDNETIRPLFSTMCSLRKITAEATGTNIVSKAEFGMYGLDHPVEVIDVS